MPHHLVVTVLYESRGGGGRERLTLSVQVESEGRKERREGGREGREGGSGNTTCILRERSLSVLEEVWRFGVFSVDGAVWR